MKAKVGPDLHRLRHDFPYFAEHVLGLRLWPGQRKVAARASSSPPSPPPAAPASSTVLVALALWVCFFREPGARCVFVSAAESSAKDRIDRGAAAARPIPSSHVARRPTRIETRVDFRNGATLFCQPASARAVRGLGQRVKLVVLDESSLIDESIWTSAMFLALDHKADGARIIVADVPWGSR